MINITPVPVWVVVVLGLLALIVWLGAKIVYDHWIHEYEDRIKELDEH